MASKPFLLEDVVEGLSSALSYAIQEMDPRVKDDAKYAKDKLGIDLKRIQEILAGDDPIGEKQYDQIVSAFRTVLQKNPTLSSFMDAAIRELGGYVPKGALDQIRRELSGSAKRLKESPVKSTRDEIDEFRDKFLKTLSTMGVRGKSSAVERFLKGKAKSIKGLRGTLIKEENKYRDQNGRLIKGDDYEVVVKDLVLQFVASELRRTVSRGMVTTSKRVNPEQNAAEVAEAKKLQSELGKLGFPTTRERGGGRITAELKEVRTIGLKDPATASFLLGLLFFDDKGKPRRNLANFSGDWGTIVRAVADTGRGTPLERLQQAVADGTIDKGLLRILGRNADNLIKGGPHIAVKRLADGSFDVAGLLETYKDPATFVEGLISSMTSLGVKGVRKAAQTTTGEVLKKDRAKAERKRLASARRAERDRKKLLAEKTEQAVRDLVSEAATLSVSKIAKRGKVPVTKILEDKIKELDAITAKLKEASGPSSNVYSGAKREKLVAQAEEIAREISSITNLFNSFSAITGLTRKQRSAIKEAGFSVGVSKSKEERIAHKISLATNRETGSRELSTAQISEIQAIAERLFSEARISNSRQATIVAKIISGDRGGLREVSEADTDEIIGYVRQANSLMGNLRDSFLAGLKTQSIKSAAKAKLRESILGLTTNRISGAGGRVKGVNETHARVAEIVSAYVAKARHEFALAQSQGERLLLARTFILSMFQFQKMEDRIIAAHLGQTRPGLTEETRDKYSLLAALAIPVTNADGKQKSIPFIKLTGRITRSTFVGRDGKLSDADAGTDTAEFLHALDILATGMNLPAGTNLLKTLVGLESPREAAKALATSAIEELAASKAAAAEKRATREKEALETIRKILAGDKAAFSDPAEMLKLVSYISSARGGKLTATNFIQSLLQKASDQGGLNASKGDLSKLAGLFKMGADGQIVGPGTKALVGAGGLPLAQLADDLRKALDPKAGDTSEIGKALGETLRTSFLEGGQLFKKVATKGLEKDLTKAAEETGKKLEAAQVAKAKREARDATGPRVSSARGKLGELTQDPNTGEFVDAKGRPLGYKGKGFANQGVPKQGEKGLGDYLVNQGLIAKPADLVMKPGEGRGSKPTIDLDKTTFVSEAAKTIAGIVQDVRAKAMRIDPATGAKVTSQVADSISGLLKGNQGTPIGKALAAAIDEVMADPTVKRTFTRGGVKMEQTAPEYLKEQQDKAAAKGKPERAGTVRKRFIKTFKGTAATAVAARLGIDVAPGVDPGKAIAENLAARKAAKVQAKQESDQADEEARRVRALRREVRFRQKALANQTQAGGELAEGQQGPATTAAIRANIARQRVRLMPLHERSAAYAQMGLGGAPARAAGGAPQGQTFTGQGMQFVPGATIAIPQVDIGPLKELASQMAEVGKSLALIPKATIPKGMSASLKEIASLMQVLATVKSPPKGANVAAFKKLIQDLNALSSAFGGKAPNTKNVGNIIAALRSVNKILDALSAINTKTPAKTLLENMKDFRKSLSFIPKMFSSLGNMDFAGISNIGATIASTKFPSQQRLAGINEALLMIKQILETANGMKGGRMPTVTGGSVGGGGALGRVRSRVYARQEALAQRIQGPGFGRYGRNDRFGSRSIDAVRAMPLQQRLDYYDQIRAEAAGGGRRPPRERPVRTGGGGGGNRFGGRDRGYSAPAGQFGVPRQIGGPMGPQISTGGVQQFSNDAMGILGNLAQQIRFGFTQEVTREIAQSFGRILAHLKDGIVKFNSTLETATVAFQTLFENEQKAEGMEVNFKKAKEEAEGLVEQIKKFANVTPFRFPQLAESARRMRAFGFETEEIMPNMQAIGDAVAALGGEDDKIFRITYALGQMRQAGRVYQNDMMQLANAGIAGYDILSKALLQDFVKLGNLSISHNGKVIDSTTIQTEEGYDALVAAVNAATNDATRGQVKIVKSTSSEIANIFTRVSQDPIEAIRDLTQSGQIAGGAAASAIIEGLGQEYGGGMRKLSKTFEGAFSTLADVTQSFVADITRPIFNSIRDEMIELGTFLQSMFVANLVKNVANGFEKIVAPLQEVIGSIYRAISSVITGVINLFGEFSGAFNLMDNKTIRVVNGIYEIRTTFEKSIGAGQEFVSRIGGGLKIIADLMQFPLAKGLAAAAVGFKILSLAFSMNPLLIGLTAITISLTYLKDFLSGDLGSGFAKGISGIAASLTGLAASFKQQIMPLLQKIMQGIGTDFFVGLIATMSLMVPILRKVLALFNGILEIVNSIPMLPDVLGMVAGLFLLKKMLAPLGTIMMGKAASVDVRGNPVAATGGILGRFESAIRTLTAKLLPSSTLLERAPTAVMQRGPAQVPVGTLGRPGAPTGFGAIAGDVQKMLVPAANKNMLSSQVLKKLLADKVISQGQYEAAVAARRAAIESAARAGTGPGGISGLRALAQNRGGLKAALSALGGQFADSSLSVNVRVNAFTEALAGLFKVLRNLRFVVKSVNGIKSAGIAIGSFTKSLSLAAKALPKAAFSAINRLLKSFVLASALKFNSTIFSIVPKVFVPFMEQIKATGPRGTGGDIIGSVRRAAAAGMNRAGRLSLAGAQVPFAMPRQGVTGGPIGYLVRAIRGLRPNRLPFEAPGQTTAAAAQRTGVINRTIQAVLRRIPTQVPVGTLGAPGRPSGFGAIIGRLERVLLNVTQGSVAQAPGRIRPQVLGGSPSMYGVSIFKVIQERIKYLTGKVADTAGLYTARITTTFEKSFMAFHKMMIRLAGAPARIFTMQNLDRVITRFSEGMVKAFAPKTVPMAGFLAGGTQKAPTELFSGLKDAIARRVIPNTLVGAPGPTFTDKIFAGADKLAKVSERFAEMMVRGFAPRTVPIEKFLAGGTARAPKEMFTGLKDAIARIVIPDKFTQPISVFQRAVMFFQSATTRFGSFIRAIGAAGASAGSGLAGGLARAGGAALAGGGSLFAAFKQSKAMQNVSASLKTVSSGIKSVVSKFGIISLAIQGVMTAMTIDQRMKAEKGNEGAIVAQEGAGMAGSIGGFFGAKALGARLGGAVGTFLGGPFGTMLGMAVGGAIASLVASFVFPNQEVSAADQEKTAKEAQVAEYMQSGGIDPQEFIQLLTDFDFTPIELLDLGMMPQYEGSIDSLFEKIQNGVNTVIPGLGNSIDYMLQGIGDAADVKDKGTGLSFTDYANNLMVQVKAKMAEFYVNTGKSPLDAMVLASAELAKVIADMGQVKTLEEAQAVLNTLARGWEINPEAIKGYNLFIGGTNNGLEKLQTNLEKIRTEFQKLAGRLQSRINAVFEQQMTKALEKAKDAFLATQMVMVDGAETNILALREEIDATEKRNKLLAIEKKLRDAARSVEMAKLGQYDASMDPLEAAARMREAQEAQTEAVKDAALERKKIALEEAMASDPVVAGLEEVDERFEAARMKFQEGMEDILDDIEAGKITGAQAAAKIKELYTTTLGEVGVLDANLDVDAKNFGDSFLGTWETILKKFESIVTKLKKAIAAVNSYKPPTTPDPGTTPSGTAGLPNSDSVLGGRAQDNWRGHGIPFSAQMIKDSILTRAGLLLQVLQGESKKNLNGLVYTDETRKMGYSYALSKAITSLTTPSGVMYKKIEAAKNDKNGMEMITSALQVYMKPLFKYFEPVSGKMLDLKYPLANMASGGTIMGEGGMFQVGEAGRETLQVVPGGVARVFPRRIRPINQIGMAGGSGGGINASVIINNPTVRSDQDIRKLADAVGKAQSSLLRSAGIGRI